MFTITINEVHPNPESGSEWIEFEIDNIDQTSTADLRGFTISDASKQIYQFTEILPVGQKIVVVEVVGLNNDQDSVSLKNQAGEIVDTFSYTSTQKGMSWSKVATNSFLISSSSRGVNNPTPTPTPNPSPVATTAPSNTPTKAPLPGVSTAPNNRVTPSLSTAQMSQSTNSVSPESKQRLNQKIQMYPSQKHYASWSNRLVFMGDRSTQKDVQNAIMGSLLLVAGSMLLLYVKILHTRKRS